MADKMPSTTEFRTARSDSTSSASTSNSTNPGASSPPRRRSSNLFEGLENLRRNADPASKARRQSLNEQRPAPGFLGKMWSEYVILFYNPLAPHSVIPITFANKPLPPVGSMANSKRSQIIPLLPQSIHI
ncbi:hypothetical protein QBC42DRAFT_266316 [Cladorrhinum samala]|uniref:Conidiation-specific protein 8 n=1 Tax=Cladorrhinum samala TaxID=585594 RepID=A0AAV9HQA8_9PEZI|nr:hypothetical protein QBC42DRAFT_266316 [Cladorrhinum samala]